MFSRWILAQANFTNTDCVSGSKSSLFKFLRGCWSIRGEVVTTELQRKLWPADTFVDFVHGLNKAVNKIRDAPKVHASWKRWLGRVTAFSLR